jgi:hypothetical protein
MSCDVKRWDSLFVPCSSIAAPAVATPHRGASRSHDPEHGAAPRTKVFTIARIPVHDAVEFASRWTTDRVEFDLANKEEPKPEEAPPKE